MRLNTCGDPPVKSRARGAKQSVTFQMPPGDDATMTTNMSVIGEVARLADVLLRLRDEELVAGMKVVACVAGMEVGTVATTLCDTHASLTRLLDVVGRARDRVLAACAPDDAAPN